MDGFLKEQHLRTTLKLFLTINTETSNYVCRTTNQMSEPVNK